MGSGRVSTGIASMATARLIASDRRWPSPRLTTPPNLHGVLSEQDVRGRIADAVRGLRGIARVTLSGALPPEVDLRPRELQSIGNELDALQVVVGEVHLSYDFATGGGPR